MSVLLVSETNMEQLNYFVLTKQCHQWLKAKRHFKCVHVVPQR